MRSKRAFANFLCVRKTPSPPLIIRLLMVFTLREEGFDVKKNSPDFIVYSS